MRCDLCNVERETVPVKINLATIQGPKDTTMNICKECLELSHQAYLNREFLAVKAGTGGAAHGGGHDSGHGDSHH